MADVMEFPKTMQEFVESYSFIDIDEVYTNGCMLVPTFRVEQAIEHYEKEIREKAIDEVMEVVKKAYHNFSGYDLGFMTKYGNKNASQQAESYSTLMMYEIAGEFDDLLDSLEQLKGVRNNEIN